MRLKDIRTELERRNLSADGDRETLENRLTNVMDIELGFNNNVEKIPNEPVTRSAAGKFKFGLLNRLVCQAEDDSAGKASVFSRLGARESPVSRKENSLGPKASVRQRFDPFIESNGGVSMECIGFFEPTKGHGSSSLELNGDGEGVFSQRHREARAQRFATNNPHEGFTKKTIEIRPSKPLLVEVFQEYDVEKMQERALKLAHCPAHIPTLKRRARRFDEECANELAQVSMARRKNDRFKRFKLGDESSSEEEEEEEEVGIFFLED